MIATGLRETMNILRLHPENGDPTIVIDSAIAMVGRDPSSDVQLGDASVSRQHAEITRRGEDWVILDQNSGNGIFVDGRRRQQAVLLPGQRLQIGSLKFKVEIDRGNDGATLMLGRSPLLEEGGDRTMLGDGPPSFPPPDGSEGQGEAPRKTGLLIGIVAAIVVLVGSAFVALKYFSDQKLKARQAAAAAVVRTTPTPRPTPTPEPTPSPSPVPTRRPAGWLLVSTDVDVSISLDGRPVAPLKASGVRRFDVSPGEHIVRFQVGGEAQTEMVVRVRVNEQTVVRHQAQPPTPIPSPLPLASIGPR